MKVAENSEGKPVMFEQVIPLYDWIMRGTEPLLGKYLIWNYPNGKVKFKCCIADESLLARDIRFFQLPFIIHHNLHVGIV